MGGELERHPHECSVGGGPLGRFRDTSVPIIVIVYRLRAGFSAFSGYLWANSGKWEKLFSLFPPLIRLQYAAARRGKPCPSVAHP